jgi:HlyD family secretion protein
MNTPRCAINKILPVIAVALLLCAGCSAAPLGGGAATPTVQPAPTTRAVALGALSAQARVVPSRASALGLPSGGIVAEVLVAEGDKVQAGQALLRLDQARAMATVAQAEAELAQAQAAYEQRQEGATPQEIAAAEAQLHAAEAQQRQTGGSVTPADRTAAQAQLQQARARLAELQAGAKRTDLQAAEAQLAQAQADLTTQRDGLSAAKTNAQLQMQQRATDLTKAQAEYATAKRNWEYAQETGKDPNAMLDSTTGKAVHVKLDDRQKQQYYDAFVQAEATMHGAEVAVTQAQVAYDTARQAEVSGIQAAEQQVAGAQVSLDKLRAGADTADLAASRAAVASSQAALDKLGGEQRTGALDAAQAAVDQAQANLDKLRAGVSKSDLAVAGAEVQRAQAALKLAQVAVDEAELRAPFAGTIGALDARVGEYVAPATPVVQLADLATWEIETTDLTEQNIVRVHEGSQATVTFDALPDLELPGTVSRIRALGENKQGDITYAVTIKLGQQDQRLHWNMTASVTIAQ